MLPDIAITQTGEHKQQAARTEFTAWVGELEQVQLDL